MVRVKNSSLQRRSRRRRGGGVGAAAGVGVGGIANLLGLKLVFDRFLDLNLFLIDPRHGFQK